MDRIMILTNTLPEESNISVIYKGDVAVVVARDNQERLLFKVTTTAAAVSYTHLDVYKRQGQTRATEWYYQIEKGFSQPNGGTSQSDSKALEAVRGDLYENSVPGGGDGMGYAYGQCTWGVASRINQLGLKLKGRSGDKLPIISNIGNGQDWVRTATSLGGETGTTPKAGAIISFAGGAHGTPTAYGHVAFIEKVYPDGSFLISETNYNGNPNYTFRKLLGVDSTCLLYTSLVYQNVSIKSY